MRKFTVKEVKNLKKGTLIQDIDKEFMGEFINYEKIDTDQVKGHYVNFKTTHYLGRREKQSKYLIEIKAFIKNWKGCIEIKGKK